MTSKPPVSFIGLGAMGFGMATHLVKEGYTVTGFDVWAPTLERFRTAGGQTATTPAQAVADKAFCVCMVATAQQAQAVLIDGPDAAVSALPRGAVLLLCSTVPCQYAEALNNQLQEIGRGDVLFVDCPVSGGAIRAADGTLSIMAGASDDAISAAREILQAMSDPGKLYIVGGGVGAGSNMKMCHQVLAANQICSASEAMGFAAHLGLDLAKTADAVLKSGGRSWMFENRLPRLLHPEHKPVASALTIILKDTGIITSEARRRRFATPLASAAEQAYFAGLGMGYGPDDDTVMMSVYTQGVGKVGPVQAAAADDEAKTRLVIALLEGIHLCSAAEALAFAHHVNLDLDQVFELCTNAAGGSGMLDQFGPGMLRALKGGAVAEGWETEAGAYNLQDATERLQAAVDEGQRLKMPLFLGTQALNLMRLAARSLDGRKSAGSVVKLWTS